MGHARPHRPTRRSGSLDLHLHRRGLGDVGLAALGAAALGRLRPARRVVAEVEGAAALAEAEEAREATEAAEHDAAEAVVLVDGEPQWVSAPDSAAVAMRISRGPVDGVNEQSCCLLQRNF